MGDRVFREGGPHNIRRAGPDQFSMDIKIPADGAGMTGRACPDSACSPGRFKVKCGTGITIEHAEAFCPYCRRSADPNDFMTPEQARYVEDVVMNEAAGGIERMLSKAFGTGPLARRKVGSGPVSIELSYKPGRRPPVRRPWEEQLRRDLTCPHCTLEHAVYGLAVWCPDCGQDIFVTHVQAECAVVRTMLQDVDRRSRELGPRVAARDIENGLEDTVSILEAALKAMCRRRLLADGASPEEAETVLVKKVRNRFQSYERACEALAELFGLDLSAALAQDHAAKLVRTLEKRHPITHNLGIVDRKYLDRVSTGEAEGRDVSLDEREVIEALDSVVSLARFVHSGLFPS